MSTNPIEPPNPIISTSHIKEGDTFKNYKHLCEALSIPIEAGNSKKAQLKELERYFKYTKKGHSFIITHIYKIPLPANNNKTKYISTIQRLILDKIIHNSNNGYLFITRNNLLQELRMINQNYIKAKYKQLRLSKHLDISLDEIKDFYSTSDDLLKRNIESALNSLESQFLIDWTKTTTVCLIDTEAKYNEYNQIKAEQLINVNEYGEETQTFKGSNVKTNTYIRKATEEERENIKLIEKEVALKYNCNSERDIFIRGIQDQFYREVNSILFDKFNIYRYFKSYEIVANNKYITNKWKELNSFKLDSKEKEYSFQTVNKGIKNRINENSLSRHKKANTNSDKMKMRMKEDYINNTRKLNNILIDSKAKQLPNDFNKYN
ncbi:hypothetical protein [Halalkalibacter oceani]|uniref:hypothetical protein n=1 Tax=Halalkalibacter oceani TaxID=1653776 RepID=UPI00339AFE24